MTLLLFRFLTFPGGFLRACDFLHLIVVFFFFWRGGGGEGGFLGPILLIEVYVLAIAAKFNFDSKSRGCLCDPS